MIEVTTSLDKINPEHIWDMISESACNELHFSKKAIAYFRHIFVDKVLQEQQSIQTPLCLACDNQTIAGVMIGSSAEGGVGTVIWLIVSPQFRGRGVGKLLFKKTCQAYRALGCHKLKLTAPTADAVRYYEKMGMQVEGHHLNHWWGMDFWSLGKQLTLE